MANGINSRSTAAITMQEKNALWGYPALYRQFEEEVLPAMRAVDELRFRPPQVLQLSQESSRRGLSELNNSPPLPIPQTVAVGMQDRNNRLQKPLRLKHPYEPFPTSNSLYPLQSEYWLPPNLPRHARPSVPVTNSPFMQALTSPRAYPVSDLAPLVLQRPSLDKVAQRRGGPLLQLPYSLRASSGSAIDPLPTTGPYSPVWSVNQAIHAPGGYIRRPDPDANLPQHARPSAPVFLQVPTFQRTSTPGPTDRAPPLPQHPDSYTLAGNPSTHDAAQRQGGPLSCLSHIALNSSETAVDPPSTIEPRDAVRNIDQATHESGGYERDAYGNRTLNMEQVAEGGQNADPVYSNGIAESTELQEPPISSGAAGADGGHNSVNLSSSPRADEDQESDNEDGESQRRRDHRRPRDDDTGRRKRL